MVRYNVELVQEQGVGGRQMVNPKCLIIRRKWVLPCFSLFTETGSRSVTMWCKQVQKAVLMGSLQAPAFGRFRLISQGITDSEDKLDV